MIRIVVEIVHTCPDGEVTGRQMKTFEIGHDEMEKLLRAADAYSDVSVIGAEILGIAEKK